MHICFNFPRIFVKKENLYSKEQAQRQIILDLLIKNFKAIIVGKSSPPRRNSACVLIGFPAAFSYTDAANSVRVLWLLMVCSSPFVSGAHKGSLSLSFVVNVF